MRSLKSKKNVEVSELNTMVKTVLHNMLENCRRISNNILMQLIAVAITF